MCFGEALKPEFIDYARQIIANCQALCETLQQEGLRIVTGGTDNHLILADVKSSYEITGKKAEALLDEINITCNKNTIPFDQEKPFVTSGIDDYARLSGRRIPSGRPLDHDCAQKSGR